MRISGNDNNLTNSVGLDKKGAKYYNMFNIHVSGMPNTSLIVTPQKLIMMENGKDIYFYKTLVISYASHKSTRMGRIDASYSTCSSETLDTLDDFMYKHKYLSMEDDPEHTKMAEDKFRNFMEKHYSHLMEFIPIEIKSIRRVVL